MQLGLNNNTNYSSNIIKLVDGAFRIPSKQGVSGAEMRKAMNPATKETVELWEIPYRNLTAYIKDIVKEESKFGAKVNVILQADREYKLTLNPDNQHLLGIYKRLPNIDPTLPIEFSATQSPDEEGKMQTSLFMSQNKKNIAWYYTNANPNGMPLAKKVTFNGKEMTDKTEQIEFLWQNSVMPFLSSIPSSFDNGEVINTEILDNGIMDDIGEINPEDIPFN